MSRNEAKRRFCLRTTRPPRPTSNAARTPTSLMKRRMAYKDIDAVMAAQADLVEIVHTLRQVVCVKG